MKRLIVEIPGFAIEGKDPQVAIAEFCDDGVLIREREKRIILRRKDLREALDLLDRHGLNPESE